jgi:hypothetical protein
MKSKMMGVAVLILALTIIPFATRNTRAAGATIYVPDDYTTVQAGIDAALDGDTVIVRDGTYLLTAALDFNGKAITVKSENGAANCFLDGQNTTRVVYFHSGEANDSVLSGFTIRKGFAPLGAGISQGGGIFIDGSSPTITMCVINANSAYINVGTIGGNDAYGGGIYCNASSAKISNCTISGNRAESYNSRIGYGAGSYGGGIYMSGGSPSITNCTIIGNIASSETISFGGGISASDSSPSISDSTISSNSVSSEAVGASEGGGIYFSTSTPSIVNTIINGNSAPLGAGIYFDCVLSARLHRGWIPPFFRRLRQTSEVASHWQTRTLALSGG